MEQSQKGKMMMKSMTLEVSRRVTTAPSTGSDLGVTGGSAGMGGGEEERAFREEVARALATFGEEVKRLKLQMKQLLRENEILQEPSYRKQAQRMARGM